MSQGGPPKADTHLTFDVSGGRRQPKLAGGRPLDGTVRRHGRLRYLLPPKTSNSPPTTIAPTPAHIGTLTVCLSFADTSSGPSFTTVVSFV